MTALRRYLGALVAVCVAFAAGIALGNGPLQGSQGGGDHVSLAAANAQLGDDLRAMRRVQAFETEIGSAARPALLDGRLAGTSVGIFVLPGVAPATVGALVMAVGQAGGEVAVRAKISAALVDPAKKTYVDSVATSSLRGAADLRSAAGLTTYPRIAALMARAYTGTADALAVDDEATRLDAQLRGARLISLVNPLQRRASAIVVLTPGDAGSDGGVYAAHQIELQLIDGLAAHADGLLLAGPVQASISGGLIDGVQHAAAMAHAVATLNVVGTPATPVAVVGGLAAVVAGQPGDWGIHQGVPSVPPGFASGP